MKNFYPRRNLLVLFGIFPVSFVAFYPLLGLIVSIGEIWTLPRRGFFFFLIYCLSALLGTVGMYFAVFKKVNKLTLSFLLLGILVEGQFIFFILFKSKSPLLEGPFNYLFLFALLSSFISACFLVGEYFVKSPTRTALNNQTL